MRNHQHESTRFLDQKNQQNIPVCWAITRLDKIIKMLLKDVLP